MKFKFDWRSIDCSKMPDYSFWNDDKFWGTADCELIPNHCYIKFIKGFNISDYIAEASVKEYGTR